MALAKLQRVIGRDRTSNAVIHRRRAVADTSMTNAALGHADAVGAALRILMALSATFHGWDRNIFARGGTADVSVTRCARHWRAGPIGDVGAMIKPQIAGDELAATGQLDVAREVTTAAIVHG